MTDDLDLAALQEEQIQRAVRENEAASHEAVRQRLARVELGQQIRRLLDGPIGQRLARDADAESARIKDLYIALDPDDPALAIERRALRTQLGICEHWQVWFGRYLDDGRAAEAELADDDLLSPEAT